MGRGINQKKKRHHPTHNNQSHQQFHIPLELLIIHGNHQIQFARSFSLSCSAAKESFLLITINNHISNGNRNFDISSSRFSDDLLYQ